MPRAVGCRDQNDFGADEEFGFAAPIVSNHAYATRAGVEIGYRLLPRVHHGGDPGLKIFDPLRGRDEACKISGHPNTNWKDTPNLVLIRRQLISHAHNGNEPRLLYRHSVRNFCERNVRSFENNLRGQQVYQHIQVRHVT